MEQIGWSLEDLKVQTVSVIGYEELLGMGAIPDLLRYLAFFPLLTELRAVCYPQKARGNGLGSPVWATHRLRYPIVDREVRDKNTDRCKRTIPQVDFGEDREDQTVLSSGLK